METNPLQYPLNSFDCNAVRTSFIPPVAPSINDSGSKPYFNNKGFCRSVIIFVYLIISFFRCYQCGKISLSQYLALSI